MSTDLSVVIINFNTPQLTLECIESVRKFTKGINYEIILIENGTESPILKYKDIKIIRNKKNVGFGGANNQGIKTSIGRYILFLNSDTLLIENSLQKMVDWMDHHPKSGAVSSTLLYKNNKLQTNGGDFPNLFRTFMWASFLDDIPGIANIFGSYHATVEIPISNNVYKRVHQQDWISGAVFMIRHEILEKVGGFDDDIFMYGEDVEYSYRIKKAGWEIWYLPITKIIHYGSASSTGETVTFIGSSQGKKNSIVSEFKGLKKFYEKHYPKWQYGVLQLILKKAAILRIFVFGIIGRQGSAIKIYANAYREI